MFADAGGDPPCARVPERTPTGIELGAKPNAGRSDSNPEPARLSPPTEDKADRAGDDGADAVPLLPELLGAPLLGD